MSAPSRDRQNRTACCIGSTTSSPRYAARVQFITIHFAKRSPWLSRGVLPSGPGVLHQSVFHQNWFLMFSGDVARSAASAADRNSNAPLLLGPEGTFCAIDACSVGSGALWMTSIAIFL